MWVRKFVRVTNNQNSEMNLRETCDAEQTAHKQWEESKITILEMEEMSSHMAMCKLRYLLEWQ